MQWNMNGYTKFPFVDNLRNLTDMLIAAENEAKQETGNDIVKQLDEDHYVNMIADMFFGNAQPFERICQNLNVS